MHAASGCPFIFAYRPLFFFHHFHYVIDVKDNVPGSTKSGSVRQGFSPISCPASISIEEYALENYFPTLTTDKFPST
jgi:hypothetical protein